MNVRIIVVLAVVVGALFVLKVYGHCIVLPIVNHSEVKYIAEEDITERQVSEVQEKTCRLVLVSDDKAGANDLLERLRNEGYVNSTCDLMPEGVTLKAQGNERAVADVVARKTYDADVILLQLGTRDEADGDGTVVGYESALFDYPVGTVCTMTGRMSRNKRMAVSKEKVSNGNFAGSMYNVVSALRKSEPEARLFILAPGAVCDGSANVEEVERKREQMRRVAHIMCIPFVEPDMSVLNAYSFLWTEEKKKPMFGKVLLLGDSYCEQRRWTAHFECMAEMDLVNLGVSSMTLKDHSSWKTAPYTAYPVKTDNTGNHNTMASQLKKLRRLMKGKNLRPGERRLGEDYCPDIVLLEGGTNDNADSEEVASGYAAAIRNDDRTTFAGAMANVVGEVRTLFPEAKVYLITPGGLYYGHTDKPMDFIRKSEQLREAASLLDIPTIDWDCEGRLSFVFNNSAGTGDGSSARPFRYDCPTRETRDLLHPNETGGKFFAETVVKELLRTQKNEKKR